MKKIQLVIILCVFASFPISTAAQDKAKTDEKAATKKEDELARVSILPFTDRTKSNNFQYMAESLSDAISKSMLKNFSYNRIDPKDVKKAIYESEQDALKGKIEKKEKPQPTKKIATDKKTEDKEAPKEKTPEEIEQDEEQLDLVKRVAKKSNSDIVIYGHYTYDNETNEIVFAVTLYLALSDAVKEIEETRNVVDVTIFKATDKVALNLVDEIKVMIEEAEKAASGKKATEEAKKEEKKPGEKMALTRKVAAAPPVVADWATKKFAVSVGGGFSMLPAWRTIDWATDAYKFNTGYINFRFWPVPGFQLSLRFEAPYTIETRITDGQGGQLSNNNMSLIDLMVFAGYGVTTQKQLYTYIDIGAGYYYGDVSVYYNSPMYNSSSTTGPNGITNHYTVKNPVFALRGGVDLLLTPALSAGISTTFQVYYDKPAPMTKLDILLNVGLAF